MINKIVYPLMNALSDSTSDLHATAVDLGPYINVGKRELLAFSTAYITSATSDATVDVKLQASSLGTTVSSDWADITDGDFTQVVHGAAGFETIKVSATKRYIRSFLTLGGTTCEAYVASGLILTPRFDT